MSIGAAFSDSIMRGLTIGLAVLSQQFPQELGFFCYKKIFFINF